MSSSPPVPSSATPSATPPPDSAKKTRWGRVGAAVRRSSTAFSVPIIRSSSPSPSERERDSDSASIKGTSKPSSLRQVAAALMSPSAKGDHMAPSPIAESPVREAAALAAEPIGPSPLGAGDVLTSSPVNTDAPVINEIPTIPTTPTAPEQPVVTSEPEEITPQPEATSNPSGEEEPVPSYSTNPPTETGERNSPPSIHVQDTSDEAPQAAPAAPGDTNVAPHPATLAPVAVPYGADGGNSSAGTGATSYFEIPAPQPVPHPSAADYSTQIWAGQDQNTRGRVSAKPSNASLATSVGWGNGHAEYGQGKSAVAAQNLDPFADPQRHEGVSPAETIRMPEPVDPRSPREEPYEPVISVPLPAMQDVIGGQPVKNTISGYNLSAKSSAGQAEQSADERIPLLPRSQTPQYGQNKMSYHHQGTSSHITPSVHSHNAPTTVPRLHALGWVEYVLPDAQTYFFHPTMRVTTDINLRNLKQLEIVTGYLDRNGEGFKVPQGCELWLRDAAEGKRRECVPVRNWIDHAKRSVSFEPPSEEENGQSRHVHEHDKLDNQYRYWSFMEAHPAHVPIALAAHGEATDVLTWSYTDRLLPLSRPVPPPFTQGECQELMSLLRSFGTASDASGIQTIVHTRIVARILLRMAHWQQSHFRPQRPLPHDAHKTSHTHSRHKTSFIRALTDFLVGFICLGIPYFFVDRSHHYRMDEESGIHSAGPILVIGACSCLVAAVILTASVTFMSLPGLDDIARIAGFVAILCSAASMSASVIALFRYKADMERTEWHYDMRGGGLMLSRRSIMMSLPLVFLAYSIAGFVTGIVIYSFRGVSVTPGHHYDDYTKWTVVGTLGGLAGVLVISAFLGRR